MASVNAGLSHHVGKKGRNVYKVGKKRISEDAAYAMQFGLAPVPVYGSVFHSHTGRTTKSQRPPAGSAEAFARNHGIRQTNATKARAKHLENARYFEAYAASRGVRVTKEASKYFKHYRNDFAKRLTHRVIDTAVSSGHNVVTGAHVHHIASAMMA